MQYMDNVGEYLYPSTPFTTRIYWSDTFDFHTDFSLDMKKNWVGIFFLLSMSCITEYKDWSGGEISGYGIYYIDGNKITVDKKGGFLQYNVLGEKRDTLLHQVAYISSSQKWRLYWDTNNNKLWVFSSDIGHSVWEPNELSKFYTRKEFYGGINTDSLSKDVLQTLRKFYSYSKK